WELGVGSWELEVGSWAFATLLHSDELDVEDERGVGRDRVAVAAAAVGHRRRDHERALAADLHARDAVVPARDRLARADRELEGLSLQLGAVEETPVMLRLVGMVEPAGVVHDDAAARAGLGAGAGLDLGDLEGRLAG